MTRKREPRMLRLRKLVDFDEKLWREVEALAEANDRSMNAQIRHMLRTELKRLEARGVTA